nr:immunoglobulin light chain junction region [Mus musculus]NSM01030.1 immunoglobulin light chain junction region [Mus musculus]NSM01475.1 immunoglobulin light chain junction region [Mus musculus]
CQQVNTLPYTF